MKETEKDILEDIKNRLLSIILLLVVIIFALFCISVKTQIQNQEIIDLLKENNSLLNQQIITERLK